MELLTTSPLRCATCHEVGLLSLEGRIADEGEIAAATELHYATRHPAPEISKQVLPQ